MSRSPNPGCRGLRESPITTRREVLHAGTLALSGLTLPHLLASQARAAGTPAYGPSFGRAKRAILLFMWGGPAQMDTWDMKPDSPEGYRGPFREIATNVDGIRICEHFPQLARRCDQLAIVRSVHHPDVNHLTATHFLLTGEDMPNRAGPESGDWPNIGAVLGKLGRGNRSLPPYVAMRPK